MYTPQEYCKLIELSSTKGKFAVRICNDNFSTRSVNRGGRNFTGRTLCMSAQPYGKGVPRTQKLSFFISQYCICALKDQKYNQHGFHEWIHHKELQAFLRPT
jgi:hypothetical protein